jgi:hypothetical protein
MNSDLKPIYLDTLINRFLKSYSDMIKEMERINQGIDINENIININLLNDDILLNINSVKEQLYK